MCDHAREHLSSYMTARDAPHREKIGIRPLEENQISSARIKRHLNPKQTPFADNQIQITIGH